MALPLHPDLDDAQVARVIEACLEGAADAAG